MKVDRYHPVFSFTVLLILAFGLINLFQSLLQIDIYHINKIRIGLDFSVFYDAANHFITGQNPYELARFVTPPFSMLIFIPFTIMEKELAIFVFTIANLFLITFALLFSFKIFFQISKVKYEFLIILITLFFSFPILFLIDRGNIDSLVWLLIIISIFSLEKNHFISGLFLAISISIKIYPIILLIPLICHKKWKLLVYIVMFISVFALFSPELWKEYFNSNFLNRVDQFRVDENASLFNLLFISGKVMMFFLGIDTIKNFEQYISITTIFIFFVSISLMIYYDLKQSKNATGTNITSIVLMYVPFLFLLPKLVYNYELVVIYSLMPFILSNYYKDKTNFKLYLLVTIGIAFTQFPVVSYEKIINQINNLSNLNIEGRIIYVIPPLGLVILIFSFIKLRLKYFKDNLRLKSFNNIKPLCSKLSTNENWRTK